MRIPISSTLIVFGVSLALPALSTEDLDARSYELAAQELAARALDELSAREDFQGLIDFDERDFDPDFYPRDFMDTEYLEDLLERAYFADLAERGLMSDTNSFQFEKRSPPGQPSGGLNLGQAIYRRDSLDDESQALADLLEREYTSSELADLARREPWNLMDVYAKHIGPRLPPKFHDMVSQAIGLPKPQEQSPHEHDGQSLNEEDSPNQHLDDTQSTNEHPMQGGWPAKQQHQQQTYAEPNAGQNEHQGGTMAGGWNYVGNGEQQPQVQKTYAGEGQNEQQGTTMAGGRDDMRPSGESQNDQRIHHPGGQQVENDPNKQPNQYQYPEQSGESPQSDAEVGSGNGARRKKKGRKQGNRQGNGQGNRQGNRQGQKGKKGKGKGGRAQVGNGGNKVRW